MGIAKLIEILAKLRGAWVAVKAAALGAAGAEAAAGAGGGAAGAGGAAAAASRASKLGSFVRGAARFAGAAVIAGEAYNILTSALGATVNKNAPRIKVHGQQYYNPRVAPYTHRQAGGPIGSDNLMLWAGAGEGLLNRVAMSGIGGDRGLAAMNRGEFGGATIESTPVHIYLDGREISRTVLRHTLRKAARGPGVVGGSQITGVATPAVPG